MGVFKFQSYQAPRPTRRPHIQPCRTVDDNPSQLLKLNYADNPRNSLGTSREICCVIEVHKGGGCMDVQSYPLGRPEQTHHL